MHYLIAYLKNNGKNFDRFLLYCKSPHVFGDVLSMEDCESVLKNYVSGEYLVSENEYCEKIRNYESI